jgi:hypothetical protein
VRRSFSNKTRKIEAKIVSFVSDNMGNFCMFRIEAKQQNNEANEKCEAILYEKNIWKQNGKW